MKGKNLKESDRVLACSFLQKERFLFFSGIVAAAMKKNVSTVCDKLCLEMYITSTFAGTNSRFTQGVGPLL